MLSLVPAGQSPARVSVGRDFVALLKWAGASAALCPEQDPWQEVLSLRKQLGEGRDETFNKFTAALRPWDCYEAPWDAWIQTAEPPLP